MLGCLRQEQTSFSIEYCFIDDTKTAVSQDLLLKFVSEHPSCRLVVNNKGDGETTAPRWVSAAHKNQLIEYARENAADYLFLVDSNIVLHPKTLEQLIGVKKDIVSMICWTHLKDEMTPQVWLFDENTQFEIKGQETISDEERGCRRKEFFQKLQIPGTYEVGGVRSCTLLAKSALSKDISFCRIKNLVFVNDNCHFCLRAAALGFSLFVDTHYPAYQIVRETGKSSLAGLEEVKKAWRGGIDNAAQVQ